MEVYNSAYKTGELLDFDKKFEKEEQRPALLDSCHAYASDSDVVKKRYPKFYMGTDN